MDGTRETWFLLLSAPLYLLLILVEALFSNWQKKPVYSLIGIIQNVYLSLVNGALDLFLRWAFYISVLMWSYEHQLLVIENVYLYWLFLFLLEDLAFYFEHYVDHYCRLFWAVHVTHHSSEEFNLTTGFRSSVFQPVYRFIYFIPLAFLGFHPLDIVFMYSLTQTYGILVHTQYIKKMPKWFEAVFVSPSHHRIHHASNVVYLDKNMGMCLIIWDRIFNTFQEELPNEPIKYGLTTNLEKPYNPGSVVFNEWGKLWQVMQQPLPWLTKLKYIFMPPGWSHDGSTKTAVQLRKAQLNHNENSKPQQLAFLTEPQFQ